MTAIKHWAAGVPGVTAILELVRLDHSFRRYFHLCRLKALNATEDISHHFAVFDRLGDYSHLLHQHTPGTEPVPVPKELSLDKLSLVTCKNPDRWTKLFRSPWGLKVGWPEMPRSRVVRKRRGPEHRFVYCLSRARNRFQNSSILRQHRDPIQACHAHQPLESPSLAKLLTFAEQRE